MSEKVHLADHLGPVSAPGELWSRVTADRLAQRPRRLVPAWVLATACFLMAGAAMLSGGLMPSGTSLEAALIGAEPGALDLHATDSERLTGWLARQGLFDSRLGHKNGPFRFLGARRMETPRGGMALVFYRQGTRTVKLAMLADGAGDSGAKRILSRTLGSGARLFDWHDNGQHYMMLTSRTEAAETACQVCHGA
ncbi:MAG: hypothetical protein U0Q16_04320 [Bryobacteraceae bacterium]